MSLCPFVEERRQKTANLRVDELFFRLHRAVPVWRLLALWQLLGLKSVPSSKQ